LKFLGISFSFTLVCCCAYQEPSIPVFSFLSSPSLSFEATPRPFSQLAFLWNLFPFFFSSFSPRTWYPHSVQESFAAHKLPFHFSLCAECRIRTLYTHRAEARLVVLRRSSQESRCLSLFGDVCGWFTILCDPSSSPFRDPFFPLPRPRAFGRNLTIFPFRSPFHESPFKTTAVGRSR